jgi:subtilisin family serine protease
MVNDQKAYLLQRGLKPVAVEREKEYFTVALNKNDDEPRAKAVLSNVPGATSRRLGRSDLKVQVRPGDLDQIMVRLNQEHRLACHHAYRTVGSPGTRYYVADRVFVKVADRLGSSGARELLRDHGVPPEDVQEVEGPPGCTVIARIKDTGRLDAVELTSDLARLTGVVYAEPDTIERFQPYAAVPSGETYSLDQDLSGFQWHLDSQKSVLLQAQQLAQELLPDAGISVPEAWKIMESRGKGRGLPAVVVGVIDEGFDLMHRDLEKSRLVDAMNFEDAGPGPIDADAQVESAWHGTPCAGLAIAGSDRQGVLGVAPGCSFIVARKKLEGRVWDLREAFRRVGERADVLSWSFSLVPSEVVLPRILDEIFTRIGETGGPNGNGCVLCFSAGNWNAPLDGFVEDFRWRKKPTPDSPIQRFTGRCFNGYATHPSVLAVSACTSTGRRAAYSNYGRSIALCAPSNNYDSLAEDPFNAQTSLPGLGIVTTDNEKEGEGYNPGSYYTGLIGKTAFGGTSAAAPLVAGVAALLRSVNPRLSATQIRNLLKNNASKIGTEQGGDAAAGTRGAYRQGHSELFGHGRVNAAAAVRAAFATLGH